MKKSIGGERAAPLDVLVECSCGHRFIKGKFAGWFCPSCGAIATEWALAVCVTCGTTETKKLLRAHMSDRNAECLECVERERKAHG